MREVLFRGKRTDNGEYMPGSYGDWVYGSYGLKLNVATGEHDEYIMESVYNGATNSSYFVDYKIISGTAGQYTGMTDKNGNKIFEGDIVKNTLGKLEKVVFVNGCFQCASIERPNVNLYLLDTYTSFIEVVGNIHDEEE